MPEQTTNDDFRQKLVNSIKSDTKVYGKIIFRYTTGDTQNVQISLLTPNMMELDRDFFFMGNGGNREYRPYFLEFFADIDRSKTGISELMDREGEWFSMSLSLHSQENTQDDIALDGEIIRIDGNVIFSASEIEQHGATLIIKVDAGFEQEVDKIYHVENLNKAVKATDADKNKDLILSDLHQKMDRCKGNFIGGFIYRVGHGNFVHIHMDDYMFIYDIGMSYRKQEREIIEERGIWTSMGKLKPEMIVLSHWDIDHILGVSALNHDIVFQSSFPWIAPELRSLGHKISAGAYRLCMYLLKRARLWLVPADGYDEKPILSEGGGDGSLLSIWKGKGKLTGAKFTPENNAGLIVRMKQHETAMLFPGDCEFKAMPHSLQGQYNFMMAPHHGAYQCSTNEIKGNGTFNAYVVTANECERKKYPNSMFTKIMKDSGFVNAICTYDCKRHGVSFYSLYTPKTSSDNFCYHIDDTDDFGYINNHTPMDFYVNNCGV